MSPQPRKVRKMKEDLYLPTEMVINILSRLPIRSIITCKFVCKSWRELVDSVEFANSHLSKVAPHLVLFLGMSKSLPYKMAEFEDEHRSTHRCKIVSNFSLPHPGVILGSVNGLLFSCNGILSRGSPDIFVCNPITREYIKLPPPPQFKSFRFLTAGVGVSKTSGQYKIVRVLQLVEEGHKLVPCVFQLHTVGTGSWRSFSAGCEFEYSLDIGSFLNGNLHWLARDSRAVTCFDLETELFTSFYSPPKQRAYDKTLSVVGDRLCFCDNGGFATEIWLMNKYGDEKSWTKEFIIREECGYCVLYGRLFPVKMFINGHILIARKERSKLLCYSKTTNAFCDTGIHRRDQLRLNDMVASCAVIYTPTFLSLRTLLMVTENVTSF